MNNAIQPQLIKSYFCQSYWPIDSNILNLISNFLSSELFIKTITLKTMRKITSFFAKKKMKIRFLFLIQKQKINYLKQKCSTKLNLILLRIHFFLF